MDDPLRENITRREVGHSDVLILIVMDDPLRGS